MYPEGHLAVLRGNLAPDGAVAKISGVKNPKMRGPARVFESEEECLAAILGGKVRAGDILVYPQRGASWRARHAGDARPDLRDHRRGPW
jgi:dihydroxy-acid dehydratase